jgi:hypothetical protein
MYSEMTKMFVLSQGMLETIVLCVIAVAVLGTVLVFFWKYVLAGIGVLFCFVVLANHKPSEETIAVKQPEPLVIEKQVLVDRPAPPIEEEKTDKEMFLEDCLEYTDYSKKKCEYIWNKRGVEDIEEKVKLLDVDNAEYKKLRAMALAKKNAVVLHATLR